MLSSMHSKSGDAVAACASSACQVSTFAVSFCDRIQLEAKILHEVHVILRLLRLLSGNTEAGLWRAIGHPLVDISPRIFLFLHAR